MMPVRAHQATSARLLNGSGSPLRADRRLALLAQTPRIAPPPPCRADGRPAFADLVDRPRSTATTIAVMPLDARLSDGSQVHLPWALSRGLADGLTRLPGVVAPTEGSVAERASLESAGRLDEFATILGAKLIVSGTMLSQRNGAALTVRINERGTEAPRWERDFIYPQTTLASIEDQIVAAVAEILATGRQVQSRPVTGPRRLRSSGAWRLTSSLNMISGRLTRRGLRTSVRRSRLPKSAMRAWSSCPRLCHRTGASWPGRCARTARGAT